MEKFTIIQIFFCQINSLVIFQKMRFFDEIFAKMQKEKSVEFDDFTIFFSGLETMLIFLPIISGKGRNDLTKFFS